MDVESINKSDRCSDDFLIVPVCSGRAVSQKEQYRQVDRNPGLPMG